MASRRLHRNSDPHQQRRNHAPWRCVDHDGNGGYRILRRRGDDRTVHWLPPRDRQGAGLIGGGKLPTATLLRSHRERHIHASRRRHQATGQGAGAGGGGGGGDGSGIVGGNGAVGFYVEAYSVACTPGVGITVTIGTAGAGGGVNTKWRHRRRHDFVGQPVQCQGRGWRAPGNGATPLTANTSSQCIGDAILGLAVMTQAGTANSFGQLGSGQLSTGLAAKDGWMEISWIA